MPDETRPSVETAEGFKPATPVYNVGLDGLPTPPPDVSTLTAAFGVQADAKATSDTGTFTFMSLFKRAAEHLGVLRTTAEDPNPAVVSLASNDVRYIPWTPSVDTAILGAGEIVATTEAVNTVFKLADAPAMLHSLHITDKADQKAALAIYLFRANVSLGVENNAPTITDGDAANILGPPIIIASADYYDLGGVSIAGKDAIGKIIAPATGTTTLYAAVVVTAGTPTFGAGDLVISFGVV